MQVLHWFSDSSHLKDWLDVVYVEKWTTWEEYEARYGMGEHNEDEAKVWAVVGFYQTLGTLVRKNLVDIKMVYNYISPFMIPMWQKMKPIIKENRKAYSHKGWEDYEWLAKQFRKIYVEERRGEPT